MSSIKRGKGREGKKNIAMTEPATTEIDTTAEIHSTEIEMAEIPGESSPRGMKRALEEEEEEEESVNESDGSEVEGEGESRDVYCKYAIVQGHAREPCRNCNKTYTLEHYGLDPKDYMSDSDDETDEQREFWVRYDKALKESEGFDVPVYPGSPHNKGLIVPLKTLYKNNPLGKQEYAEKCISAIKDYNSQNTTNYEFVKIDKGNFSLSGSWRFYYFTFQAKNADANANTDSVKTFQAKVAEPIGAPRIVQLCRLKKSSTPQGGESPPDPNVNVKAAN